MTRRKPTPPPQVACNGHSIRFAVPGPVRGKGRPRFSRVGRFVKVRTDDETASYENRVMLFFRTAHPGHKPIPRGFSVAVDIRAWFPIPASWSRTKRLAAHWHTGKPDADNILKVVCDSLNGIAWEDDSQVADACVRKNYAGNAEDCGLVVHIEWVCKECHAKEHEAQ